MAEGEFFSANEASLSDGQDFIVNPTQSETGAIELHTLAGTGSADVYKEIDPDNDGSFEITIKLEDVDSPSSSWHSQNNKIELSSTANHRLRVRNTSGNTRSYHACGIEVID